MAKTQWLRQRTVSFIDTSFGEKIYIRKKGSTYFNIFKTKSNFKNFYWWFLHKNHSIYVFCHYPHPVKGCSGEVKGIVEEDQGWPAWWQFYTWLDIHSALHWVVCLQGCCSTVLISCSTWFSIQGTGSSCLSSTWKHIWEKNPFCCQERDESKWWCVIYDIINWWICLVT